MKYSLKQFGMMFSVVFLAFGLSACLDSDSDGKGGKASKCTPGTRALQAGESDASTKLAAVVGKYDFTFNAPIGNTDADGDGKNDPEPVAGAPYNQGDKVNVEITADGKLILDGKLELCDPVLYDPDPNSDGSNPNEHEAIWFDDANSFAYAASSLLNGMNEVNVSNNVHWTDTANFTFYGQLSNK